MRERSASMLAMICFLGMTSESLALRYCPAKITLDGKAVLECGGGDNGLPDADEVWNTLKTRTFRPADHFSTLQIPDDAKEFIIRSDSPSGEPGRIIIDASCGGQNQTRSLRIIRIPKDQYGGEWMIDPEAVDKMYNWRMITREQAAYLKHPEKITWAALVADVKAHKMQTGSRFFPLVAGVFIGIMFTCVVSRLRRSRPAAARPD